MVTSLEHVPLLAVVPVEGPVVRQALCAGPCLLSPWLPFLLILRQEVVGEAAPMALPQSPHALAA